MIAFDLAIGGGAIALGGLVAAGWSRDAALSAVLIAFAILSWFGFWIGAIETLLYVARHLPTIASFLESFSDVAGLRADAFAVTVGFASLLPILGAMERLRRRAGPRQDLRIFGLLVGAVAGTALGLLCAGAEGSAIVWSSVVLGGAFVGVLAGSARCANSRNLARACDV